MNTHQILFVVVVDTRVIGCITNTLQERCFASISPTNYKNTKSSILRSLFISIRIVHGRCWEALVGTLSP